MPEAGCWKQQTSLPEITVAALFDFQHPASNIQPLASSLYFLFFS
jgi:hypothetical protein